MFCNFAKNSKWPPFFENWNCYSAEIPCDSKFSLKLLYLARFSRYKHFCVLQFLQKNRKFFENWDCYSAEIPCGSNISSKSLYLARFRDISIFVFCNFCEKFENSKWPPFWERQNFFENRDGYSTEMPCGSNISPKSLYLARFSRNKHFCVLQFLRKIQNGRHFGRDKIFLKIGIATLQRYPVIQNFR